MCVEGNGVHEPSRVQILVEAVSVLLNVNAIGKGMNTSSG